MTSRPAPPQRSYVKRWAIAAASAWLLVTACSFSLQPEIFFDWQRLLTVSSVVPIFALPSAAVSALVFRRSDIGLVLCAQTLSIVLIVVWLAPWGANG